MNASRVAIQLKVLTATFLPDLLLSMITNNCRCQSHAVSLTANSPAPVPQSFCGLLRTSKTLPPHCFPSSPCSLVRLEDDRSSEPICLWQHQRAQRKSNPCRRQPPPAARSHAQAIPKMRRRRRDG